ncbi:cyclase [Nocardiopsis sp. CNR-923]|uniref:cyclase family protein n=1 Tax=Nocardiopsis sp. CNR-923 TaxID=1904965 RepID=UPI000965717F|nr:cyclase family protein [Nocardiopsis sp. CNR-923]OLT27180.1 cyclase [Nocardiopsis sp. CNR-923]
MCLRGTGETVRSRSGEAVAAEPPSAPAAPRPWPSGHRRIADLSHVVSPSMPSFDDDKPRREPTGPAQADGAFGFWLQRWSLTEHTGTHLDAPAHVIGGGRTVPEIAPHELVVPAAVIDVRARAAEDPDTVVTVDDVLAFERVHGPIPAGAAVLMNSGWDARWPEGDEAVRGVGGDGAWHFPGFGPQACEYLVSRRGVAGVGVDTLSTDPGSTTEYPAHEVIGRADRWGLECLRGLDQLPPTGATLVVGVFPGEDASGGPCRVLALW